MVPRPPLVRREAPVKLSLDAGAALRRKGAIRRVHPALPRPTISDHSHSSQASSGCLTGYPLAPAEERTPRPTSYAEHAVGEDVVEGGHRSSWGAASWTSEFAGLWPGRTDDPALVAAIPRNEAGLPLSLFKGETDNTVRREGEAAKRRDEDDRASEKGCVFGLTSSPLF